MLVDSNKKIFRVRKGKIGSAVPLHVEHSTSPGDYKEICHEISCRNALNVALNNDRVSYLCEHLRSTDGAVLSTKEQFDLDQLKEKIVRRFDTSFSDNRAPLVVLFEDNTLNKPPTYLYLSVYEPKDDSNYSVFQRVITTFNVSFKVVSCPCPRGNSCIHIMISKIYLRQIHPELFLDHNPDTGIGDNTKVGEDLKQQKEDTQFMTNYILAEKFVPLMLDTSSDALKEIIPSEFTPIEDKCSRCGCELVLRRLRRDCRLYSLTSSSYSVSISVKDCPQCRLVFQHLEYLSGWINQDNHHVASVRLLESILSR